MANIVLGLGTNLGDRLQNLHAAVVLLAPEVKVTKLSDIYETDPWGFIEQPQFLNQVLLAQTSLEPLALLRFLKGIEGSLKREATFRYGPRIIDLDILLYDDLVMHTETLTIPHPHMTERAFVMVPLVAIAPGLIHPEKKLSMQEIAQQIDLAGVKLYQQAKKKSRGEK
jgi:2-amino-4-hydroxy-6-hydroxymethyldihydropteridine diphosphokinase